VPTWVRRPTPRAYYRPKTFVRPPVTVTSYPTTDFNALPSGVTGLFLFDTSFNPVSGLAGPIVPLHWKTSRFTNRVGSFSATISIDDQLIAGTPAHTQVRRGWHVCLIQEGNYPEHDNTKEYLLYMGVVLSREYAQDESGAATLVLNGTFRAQHLVDRPIHGTLEYSDATVTSIADVLVGGSTYVGSPGGIVSPNQPTTVESISFSNITRYAALLKLAEHARYALRETWDQDRLELVPTWGPPDPGVRFVQVEESDPGLDDAGEYGDALISGRPRLNYDGANLITRGSPIGADTPEGELTLSDSDETSPYTVQSAAGDDGVTYYYIADSEAETEYGIVDHKLIRTDVRNPSDNATTRLKAANVLYATMVDLLIRNRSEKFFFTCDVANGANVWVLPGDMVRVDFAGLVETEDGTAAWANVDRRMVIVERDDEGDPSGARQVRFVLAAPFLEFEVPGLPAAIVLPPLPPPDQPPYPPPPPPAPPWLPPEALPPPLPPQTPGAELPGGGGQVQFTLPVGVIRTNDDVLEYWDGETWQNLGDSLSTSDPGGGRTWLE